MHIEWIIPWWSLQGLLLSVTSIQRYCIVSCLSATLSCKLLLLWQEESPKNGFSRLFRMIPSHKQLPLYSTTRALKHCWALSTRLIDGVDQEGVNPELPAVFWDFWNVPGEPQFDADFTLDGQFLLLSFKQWPLMLPPIYDQVAQASWPCCLAWPVLFRPVPNKANWFGNQVRRPNQNHQNHHQPQSDCCICERTPHFPANVIVTLHFEAETSPVIWAVLTLTAYLYFYGVSVGIGSAQLALP